MHFISAIPAWGELDIPLLNPSMTKSPVSFSNRCAISVVVGVLERAAVHIRIHPHLRKVSHEERIGERRLKRYSLGRAHHRPADIDCSAIGGRIRDIYALRLAVISSESHRSTGRNHGSVSALHSIIRGLKRSGICIPRQAIRDLEGERHVREELWSRPQKAVSNRRRR